jgi:hypothetical protein
MITATDRKFMMLKKMTKRLAKRNSSLEATIASKDATIKLYQSRIDRLMAKLRGDGAKAPVPAELVDCYIYAMNYVTEHKYNDKSKISVFKDPNTYNVRTQQNIKGATVVDWLVSKIDEGLYELTMEREWTY